MSQPDLNSLPASWSWATLDDLGIWGGGGTPSKARPEFWTKGKYPWVSSKDMKTFEITDTEDHITSQAIGQSATNLYPAGTVLVVTRSGILRHSLPVAVSCAPVTINQDIKALKPHSGICPKYVAYALRSAAQHILHQCVKDGTTVQSVEFETLKRYQIPVAPTKEQARICDALDEILSDLDSGVDALKNAETKLERYRASVLKAAVEGDLTSEWRKAHTNAEPASVCLRNILMERHRIWEEEQLRKFEESGRNPPANWRTRYKEPQGPDVTDLPQLPSGWCWASLSQLCCRISDGTHQPPEFVESGVPFIFVQHIVSGRIDFDGTRFISEETFAELTRNRPIELGDVLYSAVGSYGVAVLVDTDRRFSFQRHIAHLKPVPGYSSELMTLFLNSPFCLTQAHKKARGVAQKTVTLGDLANFVLPVPCGGESASIVDKVQEALSNADAVSDQIHQDRTRLHALKGAILGHAFRGELVSQDPTDEPASELLKRIAAERATKAVKSRTRRQHKPVKRRKQMQLA